MNNWRTMHVCSRYDHPRGLCTPRRRCKTPASRPTRRWAHTDSSTWGRRPKRRRRRPYTPRRCGVFTADVSPQELAVHGLADGGRGLTGAPTVRRVGVDPLAGTLYWVRGYSVCVCRERRRRRQTCRGCLTRWPASAHRAHGVLIATRHPVGVALRRRISRRPPPTRWPTSASSHRRRPPPRRRRPASPASSSAQRPSTSWLRTITETSGSRSCSAQDGNSSPSSSISPSASPACVT